MFTSMNSACMSDCSSSAQIMCLSFFLCAISLVAQETKVAGNLAQIKGSNNSIDHDYWAVESAVEREKLPLYKIIPPAKTDELTPANGCPKSETFFNWYRSHG